MYIFLFLVASVNYYNTLSPLSSFVFARFKLLPEKKQPHSEFDGRNFFSFGYTLVGDFILFLFVLCFFFCLLQHFWNEDENIISFSAGVYLFWEPSLFAVNSQLVVFLSAIFTRKKPPSSRL